MRFLAIWITLKEVILKLAEEKYYTIIFFQLRNGVPLGDPKSLENKLRRSFGATSFAGFWQYWNPIWRYGLVKYVYEPTRRILPWAAAFITTFIVSGAIHDLATMAVSRSFAFFFTPWFFLLDVGAVLGQALGMNFGKRPFWQRAAVNFTYLLTCLLLTLIVKRELMI